jgi:kynureninase
MAAVDGFRTDEAWALDRDREDPLRSMRERFVIPSHEGRPVAYLCGNSLGLLPTSVEPALRRELEDWGALAVEAHFAGRTPWYDYHATLREPTARLVGARPSEVVTMNGLTVNLHLMLVTFYRPTAERHRVLIEEHTFPSDAFAVRSQIRHHGRQSAGSLVVARAREGETALRTEDVEALIEREAPHLALALLPGVNYYTGQLFDIPRLAACARRHGVVAGFDLAHAAGNVPLALHDWGVDFAVWCSYKYLNAGPGAPAGCFVHERHASRTDLPRFAGWWGNDPRSRFSMERDGEFVPVPGADGWQLSNPPILALAPLAASLAIFDEVGMPALRAKSERLTATVVAWIDTVDDARLAILTPRDPAARGAQISLRVGADARGLLARLRAAGVVADFREPDTIRLAPVPLYNGFHDVWRFGRALERWSRDAAEETR